jgi:hypothetical protein
MFLESLTSKMLNTLLQMLLMKMIFHGVLYHFKFRLKSCKIYKQTQKLLRTSWFGVCCCASSSWNGCSIVLQVYITYLVAVGRKNHAWDMIETTCRDRWIELDVVTQFICTCRKVLHFSNIHPTILKASDVGIYSPTRFCLGNESNPISGSASQHLACSYRWCVGAFALLEMALPSVTRIFLHTQGCCSLCFQGGICTLFIISYKEEFTFLIFRNGYRIITLSHLLFQRKPSAYLYACQDQVSCI